MMRKRLALTKSLPVILGLMALITLATGFPARGAQPGTTPNEMAYRYLEHLKKREWGMAYTITTQQFRDKIPLVAFAKDIETSKMVDNLISFTIIGDGTIDNSKARVEMDIRYLNPGAKEPVSTSLPMTLQHEEGVWRVDPGWENFLAMKLDTLPFLATFEYKGVSISLKHILLYEQPTYNPGSSHIRLDISNQSGSTLHWNAGVLETPKGHVEDVTTGNKYLRFPGYGAMGKEGEGFRSGMGDTDPGVVVVPAGSEGSIFVDFELTPESLKEFKVFLEGFSFPDTGEKWSVAFDRVGFRFDVAPAPKLRRQ